MERQIVIGLNYDKRGLKHYVNAADRDDPAFGVYRKLTANCFWSVWMPTAADRDDPAVGPTPSEPPTRLHLKDKPRGFKSNKIISRHASEAWRVEH